MKQPNDRFWGNIYPACTQAVAHAYRENSQTIYIPVAP